MEYTVYFTEREQEDLDYKADLFTAEDKPQDAQELKFTAANDNEARATVLELLLPGDKRPLRGVGKIKSCRPKGKAGNFKIPVLLDLELVKEPLKTAMYEALHPLIESGELTETDMKLRPKSRDLVIAPVRKKKEPVEVHKTEDTTKPTEDTTKPTEDTTQVA